MLEAAVIGIPDDIQGEKLVAVIVLRSTENKDPASNEFVSKENVFRVLPAFLKSRIAAYKVPKTILIVDEIPRNHLGKVEYFEYDNYVVRNVNSFLGGR